MQWLKINNYTSKNRFWKIEHFSLPVGMLKVGCFTTIPSCPHVLHLHFFNSCFAVIVSQGSSANDTTGSPSRSSCLALQATVHTITNVLPKYHQLTPPPHSPSYICHQCCHRWGVKCHSKHFHARYHRRILTSSSVQFPHYRASAVAVPVSVAVTATL